MSGKRVTATDRVRDEIDGLFADRDRELGEVLEEVARLSVRLVMQSALEAEVTEFLGRDRYARGERARAGMRNGYGDTTIKTTAGAVEVKRPKVRGTLEKFSSRLLGKHVARTNALESLVISGWVRGLSDRDIEAALREALGPDATVSKSTVSRICEQIRGEFDTWRTRREPPMTDACSLDRDHLHRAIAIRCVDPSDQTFGGTENSGGPITPLCNQHLGISGPAPGLPACMQWAATPLKSTIAMCRNRVLLLSRQACGSGSCDPCIARVRRKARRFSPIPRQPGARQSLTA